MVSSQEQNAFRRGVMSLVILSLLKREDMYLQAKFMLKIKKIHANMLALKVFRLSFLQPLPKRNLNQN